MTTEPRHVRDYAPLLRRAEQAAVAGEARTRDERMTLCCDLLWDAFQGQGLSWIGFYGKTAGADEMVLLARRDKPACSPIGLFGCCGRGWKERAPILVDDVRTLGEGYIACDPRDQSELVLPMFENDGTCWGVLDADSFDTRAFGPLDVAGMAALCETLGLTATITADALRL